MLVPTLSPPGVKSWPWYNRAVMAMETGARVGPYEVISRIGEGGMGVVYRARDTQLRRDVALKVLPDHLAGDRDRLDRFQREAQVLAALNHPNIAAIYGIEDRALVMELVEGSALAGPLPIETALDYARQIAEGLEAAHEKGIIHRDLKPANVMVTPEGVVKILDFGLAKAAAAAQASSNLSNSPTLTLSPTEAGIILGTAAYMSPEQAHGKIADRRADIWSFAAVLYEMLTGKQAFSGESVSDTLASVLKLEPDWEALPPNTPAPIRNLLKRCLIKDRRRRLQAIGEARIAIEEYLAAPKRGTDVPVESNARGAKLPWFVAAAAVVAAVVLGFVAFRTPPAQRILRYTIQVPTLVHSFAISPNGRYIAIAAGPAGKRQLWLQALDSFESNRLPTTEDATFPFWSPDSRYIGFFAQGRLRKIAISGGPAQSLCDVFEGRGASWGRDDVIVFAPGGNVQVSLQMVRAAGGVPTDITPKKGLYRFPHFLPDGQHFLYLVSGTSPEVNGVYFASVDGKENRRILADNSSFTFAASRPGKLSGHLLFVRENNLMAQPFDAARGELQDDAFGIAEGVSFRTVLGFADVSVSNDGILLYMSGGPLFQGNRLVWHDRNGKPSDPTIAGGSPTGLGGPLTPSVSPDGRMLAFSRGTALAGSADIWIRDLARGTDIRLTANGRNYSPVWSRMGDRLAFMSIATSGGKLMQKLINPTAMEEELLPGESNLRPYQYSPDGKFVVYASTDPKTNLDLMLLPIDPDARARKPIPLLNSTFNELHGQFSPDQHWIAYTSDASGRREIYVQSFPTADNVIPISITGGEMPRWRGDGKELFFMGADGKIMGVSITIGNGQKPSLQPATPVSLFQSDFISSPTVNNVFQYDVTADGQRFVVLDNRGGAESAPLNVVVNWNAAFRK